jgi:hypothetical protein
MGTVHQREKELKQKATEVAKLEAEEIERLEKLTITLERGSTGKAGQINRLQDELKEKSELLREATNAGAVVC